MFIGDKIASVQAALDSMGLGANMVPNASPAPDASKVGTAYFVNPTGNVHKGDTITVRFYGDVPAAPAQPGVLKATAPTAAGATTVTIPAYTGCPTGTTLQYFTFTVSAPSTFAPPNPVGPSVTSLDWTLAPTPGTDNTMSYVAQCSGSGGTSPSSATLTVPTPTAAP
jgi:hypothetical protein